jgi:hypothetical protein
MRAGRDCRGVKGLKKSSQVQVPVRAVAVAQKLSTIGERLQEQSCLCQTGHYKSNGHNSQHTDLDAMFSVYWKQRVASRPKLFVSARKSQE